MSVVFFEGFNYNNTDAVKLDETYWSSDDIADLTFINGRTNQAVRIPNSNYNDGMSAIKKINLSNFTSPLASNNALGIGFWNNQLGLMPECHLISFYNNNIELLSINIIQTSYASSNDSLGLEIMQNGESKGIYDFKAVTGGNYTIQGFYISDQLVYIINSEIYLEFYIDSKNTNTMRIRVNGIDMTNQNSSLTTPISGFSNIDKITLYGIHDKAQTIFGSSCYKAYDDLYLSSGNTIEDTLLGSNVRIYRLGVENETSTMEWTPSNEWGGITNLGNNDGDANYYFTDTANKTMLATISNLPIAIGAVGGIKILNTARKVSTDVSFTNVYAAGDGQSINTLGPTYSVNSTNYKCFSTFVLKNPANNNDWTIENINNLQLGVKKL